MPKLAENTQEVTVLLVNITLLHKSIISRSHVQHVFENIRNQKHLQLPHQNAKCGDQSTLQSNNKTAAKKNTTL